MIIRLNRRPKPGVQIVEIVLRDMQPELSYGNLMTSPILAPGLSLIMRMCSIKAPAPIETSMIAGHSRPILVVKYLGQIQAYAVFRNGSYEFDLDANIADAIDRGLVEAQFQFDDDIPTGILLSEP
jgi:hypothetical protein